jgi:PHS family inorganic phosphate transporter-like MFS transporter
VTTYVLSAVTYDASIRSTCAGISAAAGKVGAVIGASIVPGLVTSRGIGDTLSIMGIIAVSGTVLTHFTIPEVTQLEKDERRRNRTKIGHA